MLSANKVVLTEGIDGVLPTKYFKYVLDISGKPFDNEFTSTPPKHNM